MQLVKTRAIVINRINYSEADKIITVLSNDRGKIRLIAKGVRKQKSRLKANIELLHQIEVIYKPNNGQIYTLINAHLIKIYHHIIYDYDRLAEAYFFLKVINKAIEDKVDDDFFRLLSDSLEALNNLKINPLLVKAWFLINFLKMSGYQPNLTDLKNGKKLQTDQIYQFNLRDFYFESSPNQTGFDSKDLKFLRLLVSLNDLMILNNVIEQEKLVDKLIQLIESMFYTYIQV